MLPSWVQCFDATDWKLVTRSKICYMAHTMHCLWEKTHKIGHFPWDCVIPQEEDKATAIGNMHKKLVKIARGSGEMLADRQTDTQTCSLQYFATAPAGEVITSFCIRQRLCEHYRLSQVTVDNQSEAMVMQND